MIKLKVEDESGTVHTYRPDRLAEKTASTETSVTDYYIELEDIKLTVLPSGSGAGATPEICGYNDITAIPVSVIWRAEVSRTTGEVLLDGAIRWEDIDYDRKTKTFSVRVFDRAPSLFRDAANRFFLDRITANTFPLDPIGGEGDRINGRWDAEVNGGDGFDGEDAWKYIETLVRVEDQHDDRQVDETLDYEIRSQRVYTMTDVLDAALFNLNKQTDRFSIALPPTRGKDTFPLGPIHADRLRADFSVAAVSDLTIDLKDGSTDPEHSINEIEAHWGDGATNTGSRGDTLSHTYSSAGTYTITWIAKDSAGAWCRRERDIEVTSSGSEDPEDPNPDPDDTTPTAGFFGDYRDQDFTDPEPELYVRSTALDGGDNQELTFEWSVEGGATASGPDAFFDDSEIPDQDFISVTHTVTDPDGNSDSITKTLENRSSKIDTRASFKKLGSTEKITSESGGAVSEWPEPVLDVRNDYIAGKRQSGYTPWISGTGERDLPAWKVDRFVEEVLKYAGWRLRIKFLDFPSTRITLRAHRQSWAGAQERVQITDTEQDEGSGVVNRSQRQWGLKLKTETGPLPPAEVGDPIASSDAPDIRAPRRPPSYLTEGPTDWEKISAVTISDPALGVESAQNAQRRDLDRVIESEFQTPAMMRAESEYSQCKEEPMTVLGWPIHPTVANKVDNSKGWRFPQIDRDSDVAGKVFLVDPAFAEYDPTIDLSNPALESPSGLDLDHPLLYPRAVMLRRTHPAYGALPSTSVSVSDSPTADDETRFDRVLELDYTGDTTDVEEIRWLVSGESIYEKNDGFRATTPSDFDGGSVLKIGINAGRYRVRVAVRTTSGAVRTRVIDYDTQGGYTTPDLVRPRGSSTHSLSGETDPVGVIDPTSAASAYQDQDIRRVSKHEVEGDFRIRENGAPPEVGNPRHRVQERTKEWILTSIETDGKTLVDTIRAERPAESTHWRADSPGPGPSGEVESLTAEYEKRAIDDSTEEERLIVTWDRPPRREDRAAFYRVRFSDLSNPFSRSQIVYGTGAGLDLTNAGSNGAASDNPSGRVYVYPISSQGEPNIGGREDVAQPSQTA